MARTRVEIPDELLEAIDQRVGQRGRSRFLETAAREKLDRIELEASLKNTAGIAEGSGYRHWKDRRSAEAWVRGTRRTERRP